MNNEICYYGNLALNECRLFENTVHYGEPKEITIADNFVFCTVMENNKDLCKRLIEMIIGIKIKDVRVIKERVIEPIIDSHGIMNDLAKGANYRELRDSYVIYITMFDPFRKGLHKYTFKNRCDEMDALGLNDGATKIFLSAEGNADDVPPDVREFLAYLAGSLPESDFTKKMQEQVEAMARNKAWRLKHMTWEMELRDREYIGEKRGERKMAVDSIDKLIAKRGMTVEEACDLLEYDLDDYMSAKENETA